MSPSKLVSIRWWLPLAFAVVAAVTAIAVAQVFQAQSQAALRARARDLAAGSAVGAAAKIASEPDVAAARRRTALESRNRGVALFLFDDKGALLSAGSSEGVEFAAVKNRAELLAHVLVGQRYVDSLADGRQITVALPIRRGPAHALVEIASRPDLVAAGSIVQHRIWVAAGWATLVGALCGILISILITTRVRRIGSAANAIAGGEFGQELRTRFPDELGGLAVSVDSMRRRLAASFEDLERQRDQLRSLIEQLHEGVIGIRSDLTVMVANARATALLGEQVGEGAQLENPWPAHNLRGLARRLFSAGSRPETIQLVAAPDHTYVVTGIPAAGAETAVLVVTDVTEQARRERAEREFVANAAHELRTPIAAIASAVEVLQHGAMHEPAELKRFLDLIDRQSRRLGRLDNALLTLARAQTRAEPLRVVDIDLVRLLAEITMDMGLDPSVVHVEAGLVALAHEDLLRQAVENLITNAQRYAAGAGLTVSAANSNTSFVTVEVSDSGPGMEARHAERAAERFFRQDGRDADGFGLGLSIVREVAEAIGGRLEIETQAAKGMTARLVLRRGGPGKATRTGSLHNGTTRSGAGRTSLPSPASSGRGGDSSADARLADS